MFIIPIITMSTLLAVFTCSVWLMTPESQRRKGQSTLNEMRDKNRKHRVRPHAEITSTDRLTRKLS